MLDTLQQAAMEALKVMPINPQSITPEQIWRGVKNDPAKMLQYVSLRTGFEGKDLIKEAMTYMKVMKERYG
jgi:hypothetical protein